MEELTCLLCNFVKPCGKILKFLVVCTEDKVPCHKQVLRRMMLMMKSSICYEVARQL